MLVCALSGKEYCYAVSRGIKGSLGITEVPRIYVGAADLVFCLFSGVSHIQPTPHVAVRPCGVANLAIRGDQIEFSLSGSGGMFPWHMRNY